MSSASSRGGLTTATARIAERMHSTITRQILASLRHVGDDLEVIPHKAEKRWLGVA